MRVRFFGFMFIGSEYTAISGGFIPLIENTGNQYYSYCVMVNEEWIIIYYHFIHQLITEPNSLIIESVEPISRLIPSVLRLAGGFSQI